MQYEPDRCDPILVFVHFGFRNFGMLSIPQYILVLCEFTIISKFTHKNHILSIAVITCYIYIYLRNIVIRRATVIVNAWMSKIQNILW